MTGIHTLLIANRGEIARRIIRTAREMGIRTVAVYADADRTAPHVREADVAVPLRGDTVADTYLDVTQLLDAAAWQGADAVHPGYGFLAERAPFARAVVDAGLQWVGPPPEAITTLGDKLRAAPWRRRSTSRCCRVPCSAPTTSTPGTPSPTRSASR
ncbi:MAG: biotin carboxylase N-terminal domain-containing protein [Acidimicrobiales bacterium]